VVTATYDAVRGAIICSMHEPAGYALLDVGGGARLERFGERTVDRPAPAALGSRQDPDAWPSADLRFDRDRGWSGPDADAGPWPIAIGGLTLELRSTEAGQVGLFPEHAAMLGWLRRRTPGPVLNLFAYTGLVTLALAASGSAVTHVDSSRPTVAWARRNAERSGLTDRPVRWIVDDARAFVAREARRGRQYRGVVLDPPTYGHGGGARSWHLEEDLAELLDGLRAVLDPEGFALLTAHTPGFPADRLAETLADGLVRDVDAIEFGELALETPDGRRLELGAFARLSGGA
jgi:23S rRNA (cytosine1962-C5)-methyltransferase